MTNESTGIQCAPLRRGRTAEDGGSDILQFWVRKGAMWEVLRTWTQSKVKEQAR